MVKANIKEWNSVFAMTKNSEIRKILQKHMKAGKSPSIMKNLLIQWQSVSNRDLKKFAKRMLVLGDPNFPF